MALKISRGGSLVLERVVKAEVVESLEVELDDDELLEEDMCRFLVVVTVGAKSLAGLLGASVRGDTSFVAVERGLTSGGTIMAAYVVSSS